MFEIRAWAFAQPVWMEIDYLCSPHSWDDKQDQLLFFFFIVWPSMFVSPTLYHSFIFLVFVFIDHKQHILSGVWLLSLNMARRRFGHVVVHILVIHSFSLLYSIPMYEYTTMYLSIFLWWKFGWFPFRDIWTFFSGAHVL
jgi:hypothetical protein